MGTLYARGSHDAPGVPTVSVASAGAVCRSNHRSAREQLQGWQLDAVHRELHDDMRLAAGGARVEAHHFLEGTALNLLVLGRAVFGVVSVEAAIDLRDGSIDHEVKGL